MNSTNANKLLAGALLAGMGIITGEATLIATAGGVGVNWLAEGLANLWPTLGGKPSDPLAKAYSAAIQNAVDQLATEYTRAVDARADRAAFRLVAACADQIATAEFPQGVSSVDTAQAALDASLTALLHGHDERQATFLRERLLPACAAAFQRSLVQDETAWRAFHGVILQALAANSAVLLNRLERFTDILASWSNPQSSLMQLKQIEAQLQDLSPRPVITPSGNVYQPDGNQYFFSAHAEGGGAATVTNVIGKPFPSKREAPDQRSSPS